MTKDEALNHALKLVSNLRTHSWTVADTQFVITAIKEALAQPEQEPVAYGMEQSDGEILDVITPEEHARLEGGYRVPLYRHPPQRTWVGLKDDEVITMSRYDLEYAALIGEVQRRLKEKNT